MCGWSNPVLWCCGRGGNSGALVLVCRVRRSAYALMELPEVLAGVFST